MRKTTMKKSAENSNFFQGQQRDQNEMPFIAKIKEVITLTLREAS